MREQSFRAFLMPKGGETSAKKTKATVFFPRLSQPNGWEVL
nr:MAG TPA: hypothetical protein [Caudoviricetes sp.]